MSTIQQVIDTILAEIPGAPFAQTVDTFKSGDPSRDVTGIVTTFMASCAVLEQAAALGANLVITHEPTYYGHFDDLAGLADDPVVIAKRRFIEEHGLTLWRFHDYWHSHRPDGVSAGVVQALGWEAGFDPASPYALTIPALPLRDLVQHLKARLGIHTARVMGRPDMPCSKIGLMVGAWPCDHHIKALQGDLDVLIVGEVREWETCEYVRDMIAQGRDVGLIVLGHALSEEPGMAYLVDWLKARVPGVPVTHVPLGDPFRWE